MIHIWVIFNFGLLWIKLQWIFIIYRSLYEFFSLILGKYQRLELLRYILCVQLQKELSHRLQTDCAILYSYSMYKNCYYMIYILILAIVFIRVLQRNSTNLRHVCVCVRIHICRERDDLSNWVVWLLSMRNLRAVVGKLEIPETQLCKFQLENQQAPDPGRADVSVWVWKP